jgi:hypothetical protein
MTGATEGCDWNHKEGADRHYRSPHPNRTGLQSLPKKYDCPHEDPKQNENYKHGDDAGGREPFSP